MKVDLHTHTTASDGLLEPRTLVEKAVAAGLTTISITDHDTGAGVREVLAGGAPPGLELVAGIEISSFIGDRELHVLGYFIDPESSALLQYEAEQRVRRLERLELMLERLGRAGFKLTLEEVFAQPGGESGPGRPHVARALIAKGLARSMREVFDRLLGVGCVGYVPYRKLEAAEAAELIEQTGGVAVIAHPALDGLDDALEVLVEKRMRGIEVWHPDHDARAVERYARFARTHELIATGGSDYHGEGQKDGGELGGVLCPAESLEAVRRAAKSPSGKRAP